MIALTPMKPSIFVSVLLIPQETNVKSVRIQTITTDSDIVKYRTIC